MEISHENCFWKILTDPNPLIWEAFIWWF